MLYCLRAGGFWMAIGAVLMVVRLAPVLANMPDGLISFPPVGADQLALLAAHNPRGWILAHILGLIGLAMLAFGFIIHYQHIRKESTSQITLWFAIAMMSGLAGFAIAMVVDGFVLPLTALSTAMETAPDYTFVAFSHRIGLSFFTPAIFLILLGLGFLSSRIAHGAIHNRWFGYSGLLLASVGIGGYLAGWMGPSWNNMQTAGSVIMLSFLWMLLIGISAFRIGSRQMR